MWKKIVINHPLPFQGSKESKDANIASHHWVIEDESGYVCQNCDCRYASYVSEWPCGYPVPRTCDAL